MVSQAVSQVTSIVLTILIAVVPLWYPTKSFFRRNAENGIQKLRELEDDKGNDKRIGRLTPCEKGYSEIARTLEIEAGIEKNPVEIRLEHEPGGGFIIGGRT